RGPPGAGGRPRPRGGRRSRGPGPPRGPAPRGRRRGGAPTPAASWTPPAPTWRGWLVAVDGHVGPLERRVEQQPGGRVDVPLPLPNVQVHGQRGRGDLAALVPGGEQREGAEVVDAGRDARPVVLAAGRDAGALAPAADVA